MRHSKPNEGENIHEWMARTMAEHTVRLQETMPIGVVLGMMTGKRVVADTIVSTVHAQVVGKLVAFHMGFDECVLALMDTEVKIISRDYDEDDEEYDPRTSIWDKEEGERFAEEAVEEREMAEQIEADYETDELTPVALVAFDIPSEIDDEMTDWENKKLALNRFDLRLDESAG